MSDAQDQNRRRAHSIREALFTLKNGIDEIQNGYRFDDKYGNHKIKQLLHARDVVTQELNTVLESIKP